MRVMKVNHLIKFCFILVISSIQFMDMHAQIDIPAFPEAEGGGAFSKGGRGGRIMQVTNLNDAGPGSFREACEAEGPRIIIFRVCGIIELKKPVTIENPFLTIAGQTAPGGGITLSGLKSIGDVLTIGTNDVIIRYLRMRKGFNPDAIPQSGDCGSISKNGHNIIFDHCSFSWTQDENIGIWGSQNVDKPPRNITYSWNIVSEPLKKHPTNILTGSSSNELSNVMVNIDFHHNILANSSHRNPLIKHRTCRFVNNIVYNWSFYATQIGGGGQVDIISNIYKPGPISPVKIQEVQVYIKPNNTTASGAPSVYITGNNGPSVNDANADNWSMVFEIPGENGKVIGPLSSEFKRNSPLPDEKVTITAYPVDQLENIMIHSVGASQRLNEYGKWVYNRDGVDARIIMEYLTNKGIVPNNETEVGGFAPISTGLPYVDSDHDGMPDAWELMHGFDPNDSKDYNYDTDNDGYTNLEEFLNGSDPGRPD